MTGFGRAEKYVTGETAGRKIIVEVKSLNSKQLDLSARIPAIYREKEYEIRGAASRTLVRGKVDLFISFENADGSPKCTGGTINPDAFRSYYEQIRQLAASVGHDADAEPLVQTILKMPDVLQTEAPAIGQPEWDALDAAVAEALANINAFREQEGAVLIADLLARVATIESLMGEVVPFEPERIATVRKRLAENIEALGLKVDQNRFEQEVIFYLEKFDITEEKVRLKQHCDYFRTVSATGTDEGVGRKLGFVAQEMGREINTMGSKANHAEIQKIVVRMKDELEKIKEQLLNLL